MKSHKARLGKILAGTALALLMAGPAAALPVAAAPAAGPKGAALQKPGFLLVQDEEAQPEGGEGEEIPRRRRQREQAGEQEQPAEAQEGEQQNRRERRQAEEQQDQEGGEQPRRRQREQAGEQNGEAQPEAEQAEESSRERRRREQREQAEQQQQNAQPESERAEESERDRRRREQRQQAQEQESRENVEAAERAERERRQAEEAQRQAQEEQRQAEERRQEEAAPADQAEESPRRRREQRERAEGRNEEARPGTEQAGESDRERRRREQAREDGELPPGEASSADAEQRGSGSDDGNENANRRPRRERAENAEPPGDDRAAQSDARPEEVESVDSERGTRRRESRDGDEAPRRERRPEGTDVVRELGDRLILRFNDQTIVESNDRPRLNRDARDVYTEDLPRERTRETVVRGDGTRVVTIRNRFGDVIRRSRITPDGREYVLNYVDEEDTARVRDWRDPGLDLPPFRPNVPEEDYILDAERAPSEEDYYEFLEKPPVERVERLYSLDEVKRSARVRQKTRRVDLDTITFDFGSAAVPENQVEKLDGVASAMERLLRKNPAETFLIEGHTDAVGSDDANLALSDRRAEAVAEALTSVFAIPPENLATQGYGEQYLKVQASGPERENRRVAIRRITPLVAPVASAR